MLIDWFTVGAQALNFVILVWLLKRFLYQPILRAIDAREARVAGELADAAATDAAARQQRDEFQRKNAEFDARRAELLNAAAAEAKTERARLLDEARTAADALSARRQEALRQEVLHLSQAITRRTRQEVFAIARKALADLATTTLEERMGDVFLRRLRAMPDDEKDGFARAVKAANGSVVVRSVSDLPAEPRAAIQQALSDAVSADVKVRFETAPELVSGIELTTDGYKVGWSIADYLGTLEKGVAALLDEQAPPASPVESAPAPVIAPNQP